MDVIIANLSLFQIVSSPREYRISHQDAQTGKYKFLAILIDYLIALALTGIVRYLCDMI